MSERLSQPRDRVEHAPDKLLASVTDRGLSYPINQDDVRVRKTLVESSRVTIMVVCDGVSSGQNAELASEAAAKTASSFLVKNLSLGGDPREAMRQAVIAAEDAVRALPYEERSRNVNPPGTTIVAAVAIRKRLIVGWVGDSRCYLIDKTGARQLTHDHSWVNEMVDNGHLNMEQALKSREAHQITQCLGPLNGNRSTDVADPSIAVYDLPDYGIVLLCSDGLWNYFTGVEQVRKLVKVGTGAPDAIVQARSLVGYAISKGGKDNISVALMVK